MICVIFVAVPWGFLVGTGPQQSMRQVVRLSGGGGTFLIISMTYHLLPAVKQLECCRVLRSTTTTTSMQTNKHTRSYWQRDLLVYHNTSLVSEYSFCCKKYPQMEQCFSLGKYLYKNQCLVDYFIICLQKMVTSLH